LLRHGIFANAHPGNRAFLSAAHTEEDIARIIEATAGFSQTEELSFASFSIWRSERSLLTGSAMPIFRGTPPPHFRSDQASKSE
jgi:hypothetical protein